RSRRGSSPSRRPIWGRHAPCVAPAAPSTSPSASWPERKLSVVGGRASSERTKVKRLPDRGSHDRATIDAILDEGLVCHLGFVHDGRPFVIPTLFARIGDEVFVHGSAASRMLRSLRGGIDACLTVTLVDGIVLARSIFHHSVNYRSVVVLGRAVEVEDREEKL